MKTFTIVSSDTQSKHVFDTEATTVGELLAELDARNIDYAGKSLYEGITKAEFDTSKPEGILPHDVMYKGEQTSNLVFMLTASKKKISSGTMSRSEAYAAIKANGLEEEIKEAYGRNYTQVATADLISVILSHEEAPSNDQEEETEKESEECPHCLPQDFAAYAFSRAFDVIVYAVAHEIITVEQITEMITEALSGKSEGQEEESKEEVNTPWSEDDLAEMFS